MSLRNSLALAALLTVLSAGGATYAAAQSPTSATGARPSTASPSSASPSSASPSGSAPASPGDAASKALAHDIFKQLIEINTTDSVGSVTAAAQAIAERFRAAGFPADDVFVG